MDISLAERLEGGLMGLLIGDALGVPYEFRLPDQIPPLDQIEFDPPKGYVRAHEGVPSGTWSDDGAQALCLLASLLHHSPFELSDFANRMVNWWSVGYFAVDGRVFDIGIQTSEALRAIGQGADPLYAGGTLEWENGNGSLMRLLPLSLYFTGTDSELVSLAETQSRPTHGHLRSLVCCGVYALWARRELAGRRLELADAVQLYTQVIGDDAERLREVRTIASYGSGGGSGYVLDCLCSAATTLQNDDYESTVKAAVALGHDTDTTACVAGGIAGIRYGIRAIPGRWRRSLRGMDDVYPLLKGLLAHRASL